LGLEDCVIYLLDEQREYLVQRAAHGPKTPRAREILAPIRIRVGQGIVGTVAATLPPEQVVARLGRIFTSFDALTERHGLEKIKTIGDAYMVVAGVPTSREDHAEAMATMALDMLREVERLREDLAMPELAVRIGLHSGPVVAGIIGTHKFAYDLWGDTVNMASRLESHGLPNHIQVSEPTWRALRERFHFEPRDEVEIKSLGRVKTWLLQRPTSRDADIP
ncbi:MAG TPA: adenylate/guanylate cyclase domain-containing protein, partial [Myxococcaceae bacterium]|nr:adenylate/guanylate cyclase domain-containing protein [Myxococcaceae bacterium]